MGPQNGGLIIYCKKTSNWMMTGTPVLRNHHIRRVANLVETQDELSPWEELQIQEVLFHQYTKMAQWITIGLDRSSRSEKDRGGP